MRADITFPLSDLSGFSTDPAHLFMQLYDALPEDLFGDRTVDAWRRDPDLARRAARVEQDILSTGSANLTRLGRIVAELGARGVFAILQGLDNALWYVNPFNPAYERGQLDWLARRYAETGLLNDPKVVAGALLPRCTYPGKPRGQAHKAGYFCVHRVPIEQIEPKVDHQLMESRYQPHFDPEQEVRIACAPLLTDFTELSLSFDKVNGTATYRLAPADTSAGDHGTTIAERMVSILDKMDNARARIGVMPEGCLSNDLLERWRVAARDTAAVEKPLRWLLLGSGPVGRGSPPTNRAVLIDRWTGDTLLVHDKLERFTLDAKQVHTWRLPNAPPADRYEEDISCGSTVAIRESSLGRFAVVICQDMYSTTGWERELLAFGVSHLFVPIFSKPIQRYRWEQQAAERLVSELGAWIVVSNSLAVANAMALPANRRWYTCLVIGPRDPNRNRYELHVQYGRARAGNDLGWTNARRKTLPTVLAGAVREQWFDMPARRGSFRSSSR